MTYENTTTHAARTAVPAASALLAGRPPGHGFLARDCRPWHGISCKSAQNPGSHRKVTACLPGITRYFPALPSISRQNIAPEPVSAHRQPFSVGLTTSADSRSPVVRALSLRGTQNELMLRKENVRYCVDMKSTWGVSEPMDAAYGSRPCKVTCGTTRKTVKRSQSDLLLGYPSS